VESYTVHPANPPANGGDYQWSLLDPTERRQRAEEACYSGDAATLWSLTEAYLELRRTSGRSLSPHTRRSYRHSIESLLARWSGERLLRPSRERVAAFVQELEHSSPHPSTFRARLAGMRALYRALRWAGVTDTDPFIDVRPTAEGAPSPHKRSIYTTAERDALLAVASPVDRAMILLISEAGLRVGDCVALTWSDVDLTTARLSVAINGPRHGNGTNGYMVPLSQRLVETLRALQRKGGRYVLGFSTDARARQRMQRLCKRAGVPYRGLHALRASADVQSATMTFNRYVDASAIDSYRTATTRADLRAELGRAVAEARRSGTLCGLIMLEIDRFDKISAEYGHEIGEAIRRAVMARVDRTRRAYDVLVQLSPERFAVILWNIPVQAALHKVAQRFQRVISSDPIAVQGKTISVTAIVGAVAGVDDPEDLLQRVEAALVHAKA
jgi:integrase/recombinase XerC